MGVVGCVPLCPACRWRRRSPTSYHFSSRRPCDLVLGARCPLGYSQVGGKGKRVDGRSQRRKRVLAPRTHYRADWNRSRLLRGSCSVRGNSASRKVVSLCGHALGGCDGGLPGTWDMFRGPALAPPLVPPGDRRAEYRLGPIARVANFRTAFSWLPDQSGRVCNTVCRHSPDVFSWISHTVFPPNQGIFWIRMKAL